MSQYKLQKWLKIKIDCVNYQKIMENETRKFTQNSVDLKWMSKENLSGYE